MYTQFEKKKCTILKEQADHPSLHHNVARGERGKEMWLVESSLLLLKFVVEKGGTNFLLTYSLTRRH